MARRRDLASPPPPPPTTPPAPPEPSPLELARTQQTEQTMRWIVAGAAYTEILAAIREHFPDTPAAELFRAAVAQLAAAGNTSPAIVRGFCLVAAQEIYRRAFEAGDLPTALKALRSVAEFAPPEEPEPDDAPPAAPGGPP